MKKQIDLSIVIPVFNSASYIVETLRHLYSAIEECKIEKYEIVIVNDGSTDDLVRILATNTYSNLKLINQENSGRLRSRIIGLQNSQYESVLLIDSRVHLQRNSFVHLMDAYTRDQLLKSVISGPTRFAPNLNLIGIFWESISMLVWWRFFAPQRVFQLSELDFNHYPKGTTCLFGPRSLFLRYMKAVYDIDPSRAGDINDDTLVLRGVVKDNNFYIDKDFDAVYFPRTTLLPFLEHAFHRGKMFVSGFLSDTSRRLIGLILFSILILTFLALNLFLVSPISILLGLIVYIFVVSFWGYVRKLPFRNVLALLIFGLPFIAHFLGGFCIGLKGKLKYEKIK